MSKFVDSEEGMPQELIPFSTKTTQVVIKDVMEIKYSPINSFESSDTINFELAAQPNLMLKKVEVVTKFKVLNYNKGTPKALTTEKISLVSSPGTALWKQVDIVLNNKYPLTNPMQQSSNYEAFFATILNEDENRDKMLFSSQGFLLDVGENKAEADAVSNIAAEERSSLIEKSKSVTLITDLHCTLFKGSKLLLPNLEFAVALTKNSPEFIIMKDVDATDTAAYVIKMEKVYLKATYIQPEDFFLPVLNARVEASPAIYEGHKTEISTFGIQSKVTKYMFNNIVRGSLPHFMVLCIQDREAIAGSYTKNPFTFKPFKSIQLYINNREYFHEPLEVSQDDTTLMMDHFYKAVGYDMKGTCLINKDNFMAHCMLPVALSRDRTVKFHHNLQEVVDFKVLIEFNAETEADQVLMVYAVYDQIIKIDSDGNIEKI
jgi:hypothetical protein